jgi:acyl dehydratase
MHGAGQWFDDVAVGDRFSSRMTITETHLVLGAGLIGDFNPHHVDEEYARGSRFGSRILHGVLTSAIMGAPVGTHFHGTALAYLEHAARFKAPVRAGVVVVSGECHNQHGELVAEADGKMLVHMRP